MKQVKNCPFSLPAEIPFLRDESIDVTIEGTMTITFIDSDPDAGIMDRDFEYEITESFYLIGEKKTPISDLGNQLTAKIDGGGKNRDHIAILDEIVRQAVEYATEYEVE